MSERKFLKMHGLGNDFVIIDGREQAFTPTADQARFIADRRWGVGCDQLIVLEPSDEADVFMRIYNSDGSQAEACGNASRCVASLLYDEIGLAPILETVVGLLPSSFDGDQFEVDMGPIQVLDTARSVAGSPVPALILDMGNPHCAFLTDQLDLVTSLGPKVEVDPQFPNRTNVQFVQVLSPTEIRQRVWERGAGLTAASGSGACAGAVAAMIGAGCERQILVHMDGGDLHITWREADGHVLMRGPHALSFEGTLVL